MRLNAPPNHRRDDTRSTAAASELDARRRVSNAVNVRPLLHRVVPALFGRGVCAASSDADNVR